MKVYIVVIDQNYEGYTAPYFVGSTEENAQKWIDLQLFALVDFNTGLFDAYKEKHGNSSYEIIEMEVDEL